MGMYRRVARRSQWGQRRNSRPPSPDCIRYHFRFNCPGVFRILPRCPRKDRSTTGPKVLLLANQLTVNHLNSKNSVAFTDARQAWSPTSARDPHGRLSRDYVRRRRPPRRPISSRFFSYRNQRINSQTPIRYGMSNAHDSASLKTS
jgi:hypothetical protein